MPAVWNTKNAEQPNGSYQPVTNGYSGIGQSHDDVMPWNCFWPIVWGNHQTLMDSPHKGPAVQMFDNAGQNKLLSKQSSCWCFEMPWFSCDVLVTLKSEDEIWTVVVQCSKTAYANYTIHRVRYLHHYCPGHLSTNPLLKLLRKSCQEKEQMCKYGLQIKIITGMEISSFCLLYFVTKAVTVTKVFPVLYFNSNKLYTFWKL